MLTRFINTLEWFINSKLIHTRRELMSISVIFWDVLSLSHFIKLNAVSIRRDHSGRNPPAAAAAAVWIRSELWTRHTALKAEFERAALLATKYKSTLHICQLEPPNYGEF